MRVYTAYDPNKARMKQRRKRTAPIDSHPRLGLSAGNSKAPITLVRIPTLEKPDDVDDDPKPRQT